MFFASIFALKTSVKGEVKLDAIVTNSIAPEHSATILYTWVQPHITQGKWKIDKIGKRYKK